MSGDPSESRNNGKNTATVSFVASVKLTVLCLFFIGLTILIGAWCPQESQVGREKVFEAFGEQAAPILIQLGVSDIFHTPWFLFLIAMLTLNMVACSFQRVFPKVRSLKTPMPVLSGREISRLPFNKSLALPADRTVSATIDTIAASLEKRGFKVDRREDRLVAEYGKVGRLAATITHIGLLTLLGGVTITSWTGFSGFAPVKLGDSMSFAGSEHSKLWIGRLPEWKVKVLGTRRENYPTGEPKQWYSDLAVVDEKGKVLKTGQISVNSPLSYDGVDIYQASWGLAGVEIAFNGVKKELSLEPMGNRYASFLPLDPDSVLIFSVMDQTSPLRLFAKRTEWEAPKRLAEIKPGESVDLGGVKLSFEAVVPLTGLQYKSDPGIPVVYASFAFIIVGVLLAMIPYRHVWAQAEIGRTDSGKNESGLKNEDATILYIGGRSQKARVGFERMLQSMLGRDFPEGREVEHEKSGELIGAAAGEPNDV